MSERAGIMHITLRAIVKIKEAEDGTGAQVRFDGPPEYRNDFIIVGPDGSSQKLNEAQIQQLTNTILFTTAQMFAKAVKLPDGVEASNNVAAEIDKSVN